MQSKQCVIVCLLLGVVLFGCRSSANKSDAGGTSVEDKSPVIAEINGEAQHQALFERFVKARLSDFTDQAAQESADRDKQQSELLDSFIRRQLIVQQARKQNIEPSDQEIRAALEQQHKQTSGEGAEQTAATLASGERRLEIFNDLLTAKLYEKEVRKETAITPQEVETYYNSRKDHYQSKNGFYVREIRVHEEGEAQKLYKQALAKPVDFPVLAKEHSEGATAAGGGLIYYEAQQLPPVLEQAITPLKVGSISPVVKSNFGYHIFKLEQRAEPLPLDKVKAEIEEKLLGEKNQRLIDEFNQRTIQAARIKINRDKLGFNYVGELKPGS